jgi:deoxyuridine 5'-triphosphate nucleotidohydrolase
VSAERLYHLEAARSEEQRAYMERLEADGICIFCPDHQRMPVEFSGEHWYVTRNDFPYAGTVAHYLIIPRRHVRSFDELPDAAGAELWAVKRRLKAQLEPLATAMVERSGDMRFNGGSVAHLHTHFVALDADPAETVRFRVSARAVCEDARDVLVQILDDALPRPARAHADDAGLDLVAREDVTLRAGGGPVVVPTGVAVAIPPGHCGLVCPRSGLAARHGIGVLNGPGVIDAGYRGEVCVVLHSVGPDEVRIRRGDRIAQLVVVPVAAPALAFVDELPTSARAANGFGSTGR